MTYQEQQDILLQSYINTYSKKLKSIEFIISSACDQKCEYCYLYKHGEEMNYSQANNYKDILHNLPIILDYLEENNFEYENYDIFSGEFFNLSYWEDILEIFYQHHKKLKKLRYMTIPTNYSFIDNKEKTKKIEEWLDKLKEINLMLHLSCSIDGPEEIDNLTRPNIKIHKNENFYEDIFAFMAKHYYACHPMITKYFLENYEKNYDFLIDNTIKYNVLYMNDEDIAVYNPPMMLEVRDNIEWDEESLKNYKDFLNYVADMDLKKLFNNDKKLYAYKIFDDFTDEFKELTGYNHRTQPYILAYPTIQGNTMSCSIQHNFVIRVGDLKLAPCHRTYYSQFEYGNFVLDENKEKIIGVHGINPTLAFKIETFNPIRSNLKCGGCKYSNFCLQGCLGSQFENTGEIFGCEDNVCKMFETKYCTIHEIVERLELYPIILNDPLVPAHRKEYIKYARSILSK